jgi:adenine-specific DNA-methyltransferase
MKAITRTELVWVGKYDDEGNLCPVERTILPFQVVETVNESKADREKVQRDLLTRMPRDDTCRNMLIWGDNKVVMSSLLPRFAGKINLIYIDPPFATGQDFSFRVRVGDEEFVKEPSIIEEKAYRDTWGRGLDSYLQMMYERLVLMRELLAEDGSIWVHLDWRVVHFVKLLLDQVFGDGENDGPGFRNEIIWFHNVIGTGKRTFPKTHETILWYSKGTDWVINSGDDEVRVPYSDRITKTLKKDEKGWYYVRGHRESSGSATGKWFKTYVDPKEIEKGKFAADVWDDIKSYRAQEVSEFTGFQTQKPEKLLRRIVAACSRRGDLVADFFCGSGTTLAVAEKLGRRWIGCDLSKWAIQVTRKRLLQIEGCKPFEILNLGNYERHKLAANGHWGRYVQFILELYRAEAVTGFKTLHGKKARAYVHVGSVDSPITMREIRQTLKEAQAAGMREVHFLGWDFEMGLHDLVSQVGDDYGVKVRLVSIPREALEVTNPAKEEVRFFDLNYLELEHEVNGRKATVRLKDFIIANPEYIPDEVREKIKKFTDYIDYWAVDWDYKNDTFHNGWQSFRTRKEPKLETKATHTYDQPGTYKVLVKVVDIFGNDTTKMVEVDIK